MRPLTPMMRQHLIYGIANMNAATEKGLLARGLIETDPLRPAYWVLSAAGKALRADLTGNAIVSWKPGVKVRGEEGWNYNGQRFRFPTEAVLAAENLMGRWMLVEAIHVEESNDPVNCRWVHGKAEEVKL